MLTSAFYYDLYRPYIVSNRDRNNFTSKRARIAEASPQERFDRGMMIVLNKSLKNEIIHYAQNVSHGVTRFKSSVHMLMRNMSDFGLNAMYSGYETAMRLVEDDLVNLTEAYNFGAAFLHEQRQSPELRSFSQELREKIYQGRDRLGLLGFTFDGEGSSLQFDSSILRSLNQIELHTAIGANMQVFHSLHRSTQQVLTEPLSSHMHFRGLNYHYNYQLGRMVEDGFGMIESGMIVDRVV